MVATERDRWQAGAVRSGVVLLAFSTACGIGTVATGSSAESPAIAQAPAGAPGEPRTMVFSWTLYPRMWAELDLRLAAGAEAVAEITVEGGDVSWNLHTHPADAPPAAYVLLAQGVAARTTIRCAPDAPGLYSYLFGNDRGAGPMRLRVELRLVGDARLEAVKP